MLRDLERCCASGLQAKQPSHRHVLHASRSPRSCERQWAADKAAFASGMPTMQAEAHVGRLCDCKLLNMRCRRSWMAGSALSTIDMPSMQAGAFADRPFRSILLYISFSGCDGLQTKQPSQ
eukprot:1154105-Pelagomonas_calceolata.AAC.4